MAVRRQIMNKSILVCGVGGQGTILASKVMACAAMDKGYSVKTAETIGMAQRGGSVFSHLRFGENVFSPLIGKGDADLIIGFEPGEAVRMLPYLKKDGAVVVSNRAVMPVTASLSDFGYNAEEMISFLKSQVANVIVVDTDKAFEELHSTKVLNIVLLGAAIKSGQLGLDKDDIKAAIAEKVPEKFRELNYMALEI